MGKYDAMLNEVSANASKLPKMLEEIKAAIAKGIADKSELAELSGRYNQEKTRREEAEAAEAQASAGLAEITTKYAAADLAAGDTAKELAKLQAEFSALSKKYDALNDESNALKTQKSGLEAKLELNAQVIAEQESTITSFKNAVDQYQNAVDQYNKEIAKLLDAGAKK